MEEKSERERVHDLLEEEKEDDEYFLGFLFFYFDFIKLMKSNFILVVKICSHFFTMVVHS